MREAADPQLSLAALTALAPLTQLTSLVLSRNPSFTSAPHALTPADVAALAHLRGLTFLELCAAVPPALGLGPLARAAAGSLTALRTLAFGHTSALWRLPAVGALCQALEPACPALTDLRLRCVAPPSDPRQLPALMALPLPQRLTNFALTFARRLNRGGEEGLPPAAPAAGGGGAAALAAADAAGLGLPPGLGLEDEEEEGDHVNFGEYEDVEEPWDSVDHLAPKPGLHVLIVERGARVTRMDVNVTVSVAARDLPTVPVAALEGGAAAAEGREKGGKAGRKGGRKGGKGAKAGAAGGSTSGGKAAEEGGAAKGRQQQQQQPNGAGGKAAGGKAAAALFQEGYESDPEAPPELYAADDSDGASDDDGDGDGGAEAGAEAEAAVPPYDVTPLVLAAYNRLLGEELGLTVGAGWGVGSNGPDWTRTHNHGGEGRAGG